MGPHRRDAIVSWTGLCCGVGLLFNAALAQTSIPSTPPKAPVDESKPGTPEPAQAAPVATDLPATDLPATDLPATDTPAIKPVDTDVAGPSLHAFAQSGNRRRTRLIYMIDSPEDRWGASPGGVSVDYGEVNWQKIYGETIEHAMSREVSAPPQYWRLGANFWTTLDTSMELRFGDVVVPCGYYYVVLEYAPRAREPWQLLLLDPDGVHASRLDAWHVDRKELPSGIRIPMELERLDEKDEASKLLIKLRVDKEESTHASLRISFGTYRLATKFVVAVE